MQYDRLEFKKIFQNILFQKSFFEIKIFCVHFIYRCFFFHANTKNAGFPNTCCSVFIQNVIDVVSIVWYTYFYKLSLSHVITWSTCEIEKTNKNKQNNNEKKTFKKEIKIEARFEITNFFCFDYGYIVGFCMSGSKC